MPALADSGNRYWLYIDPEWPIARASSGVRSRDLLLFECDPQQFPKDLADTLGVVRLRNETTLALVTTPEEGTNLDVCCFDECRGDEAVEEVGFHLQAGRPPVPFVKRQQPSKRRRTEDDLNTWVAPEKLLAVWTGIMYRPGRRV